MITDSAKLHLVFELVVSQTFTRDGVFHRIVDDGLFLPCGFIVDKFYHASREAASEFLCIVAENGLLDANGRQQAVSSRRNGREFGVVGADAHDAVTLNVNLLARTQLCDKDVGVDWADLVGWGEGLDLEALRVKNKLFGIDRTVDVELFRVPLSLLGQLQAVGSPVAFGLEF